MSIKIEISRASENGDGTRLDEIRRFSLEAKLRHQQYQKRINQGNFKPARAKHSNYIVKSKQEELDRLLNIVTKPTTSSVQIHAAILALCGLSKGGCQCYLSGPQARSYLGDISRSTLSRMQKNGLPYHRIGKKLIFKTSELDEFITSKSEGRRDESA